MDKLTGCTGSIAAEIVNYTTKPVIRHVGYLFRFKKIVDDLTNAKTDLQLEQQKVQDAIEQAAMNTEVADKNVERWLENVNQLVAEVQALENIVQENLRICNGWCPDWIRQYKLCKEAIQKTNLVKELQVMATQFCELTHRVPTTGIDIVSSRGFELFESTNLAFQQIMEALRDDNSKRIGLHGMAGVGKTTLVKTVCMKARELNIFNDIVLVVVSQYLDVRRIQGEIADCLNLKLEEESGLRRASRIYSRVKGVEKILIILDDVWNDVNLKEYGIPSFEDHKGCKVLLTTRSEHVCNLMDCQRKIQLNFLLEKESLALMRTTAGIVDDDPVWNDMVLNVVKKCEGLPLAIVFIGRALRRKSLNHWNFAMLCLRNSRLLDIEGVEVIYSSLKLSYNYISNSQTKLCFLLCSLFPEDYNIPIEEITRYAMVLEEYQHFDLLEERRSQVRAAIDSLKEDSSLLLEGFGKNFVKMHNIVRGFGLSIASNSENEFNLIACTRLEGNTDFERVTAISLINYNTEQLPDKLVCPRLNIFLLGGIGSSKEISNALFEGMKCLKVLKLSDVILSSQSLELLTNLQTLYLKCCNFSDDLSSLGKLKRLETLSFYECGMVALPSELGEMVSLKLLDLTDCYELKQIPPNVIRRLSQLEELIMNRSFKNWDVEGTTSEISNLNLSESNSLSCLVILSLELNSKHLPKCFVFPGWQKYRISINCQFGTSLTPGYYGRLSTLEIKDWNASSMNALKSLFHTVEYIWIMSCEMECIVDTTGGNQYVSFSNLVELHLQEMTCLRKICEGPNRYVSFSNLTVLFASRCTKLISLFSPSLAQTLKELKELYVNQCHEMKQIISEGMILESHGQPICLPKLETLEVDNCGELEYIFPTSNARGQKVPSESYLQPLCFPKLERVIVKYCMKLKYLFPMTIAESLSELQYLKVKENSQLEKVFTHEGDAGVQKDVKLPQLGYMELNSLPSLVNFCPKSHQFTLPKLSWLTVVSCQKMRTTSFTRTLDKIVLIKEEVNPIEEISITYPELAICPAKDDIIWNDI